MKEVIIKFNDQKTLDLLKGLASYLDYSITEKEDVPKPIGKKVSFDAIEIDTLGFTFSREEANER